MASKAKRSRDRTLAVHIVRDDPRYSGRLGQLTDGERCYLRWLGEKVLAERKASA